MSKKGLIGKTAVLAIIAAFSVMLILLTTQNETQVKEKQVLPVRTVYAEKGDLEKLLHISGFVESETMITILPRIGGILTNVYVDMGDPVELDQVLASIDSEPYKLSFNQTQAAFFAAESTFKRVSSLYANKSVSQQNYDETKASYNTLKSAYELAKLNLSYTEVRAPIKGVVLEKHVSQGSMAAPNVPIVTIGDINNLKVNAGVPEIHYSFFQQHMDNMRVKITVPALGNSVFSASITNIAPYIHPQSRSFAVKCKIDDNEGVLRPGMFIYIDFVLESRKDIFFLPYQALSEGNVLWFVNDEEKAVKINYSPVFGNEEYFQITPDISSYQYILEGHSFLSKGQPVRRLGD